MQQAVEVSPAARLRAIRNIELPIDVREVELHGLLRDPEHPSDVRVRVPLRHELENLELASRQHRRVVFLRPWGPRLEGAQLGVDPDDRTALLHARSTLVIACAAAGCAPPIDGVTTAVDNLQALSDVDYARRLGMTAKLCIHPRQVPLVNDAFSYTPDELAWARRVIAAVRPCCVTSWPG